MNESTRARVQDDLPPSLEELERDRRMELVLDECVMASPAAPEAEFTARVMAARPFAAWEVRRAGAWRIPALAAAALLAASLAIFLAPLWSLGPGTADLPSGEGTRRHDPGRELCLGSSRRRHNTLIQNEFHATIPLQLLQRGRQVVLNAGAGALVHLDPL
ncbi:MAG TPA: hypothetical protein VHQ44_04745, partial [Thermoanaerobaculia bacterium]|nr:hypothetical protein [Thermoanaerobaculia bacterium]